MCSGSICVHYRGEGGDVESGDVESADGSGGGEVDGEVGDGAAGGEEDIGDSCVLVFTTKGKYVTTLKNELYYPCGVCVDKDGFMFICDNCSDRIQIL